MNNLFISLESLLIQFKMFINFIRIIYIMRKSINHNQFSFVYTYEHYFKNGNNMWVIYVFDGYVIVCYLVMLDYSYKLYQ